MSVAIRDLEAPDVDALVAYWHDSDPSYLLSLGVDTSKLGSRQLTHDRFFSSILCSGERRVVATLVAESEESLLGYASVNIHGPGEAVGHIHLLLNTLTTRGLVYVLFPTMVRIFFDQLHLEKLAFQTAPENPNVNRLLRRFGLVPQRVYLDEPDGMARQGEFDVYEVTRPRSLELLNM